MRDPRAIYVSELRRRSERPESVPYRWLVRWPAALAAFVLLQVTWSWAAAVHRHRRLSRRYPRHYRMLRFEDLVTEPLETLERLCSFLGIELEPRMLEQKVTSRGARVGEAGFDAGAADRVARPHHRPGPPHPRMAAGPPPGGNGLPRVAPSPLTPGRSMAAASDPSTTSGSWTLR